MEPAKRVLVLTEYGSLNGGENSFLSAASVLLNRGWTFQAAVPDGSEFASQLHQLGIGTTGFRMHNDSGERYSQTELRQQIAKVIRENAPTIVHSNSLAMSRLAGPVCHEAGVPSVGYLRDILKLSRKAIEDINLNDALVAVSNATRDWHLEQGMSPEKVTVVYNGIDRKVFNPTFNEINHLEHPALLFVGQIGLRKGVDVLLEAFGRIAEDFPDCELWIVGERHSTKAEAIEYEKQLQLTTKELNDRYGERIKWLGRRPDVPLLMQQATILVHAARQEPLGRVLLESAVSGLPLVATNVGGTPEIVKGLMAFNPLCEKDDSECLADKIRMLLGDNSLRTKVATELVQIAERRFGLETAALGLEKVYESVASASS